MHGLLMSAIERNYRDVGLHSLGQGANLILKTKHARAAESGGEKGLVRAQRGSSPRVSKGVAGVYALPHRPTPAEMLGRGPRGRATAPIKTR